MKCVICKNGETRDGTTTVTLTRNGTTVVVKSVPARVCSNCGEAYLDEATTAGLQDVVARAVQSGVEVEVREYVAPVGNDA